MLLLLLLVTTAVIQAADITIDLQRNAWGTTETTLKAFSNVDNSVYFKATNAAAVASWRFANQLTADTDLLSAAVDHVLLTTSDGSGRMIVATIKPTGSHSYKIEGLHADGSVLGTLMFDIEAPANPQIVSCMNDNVKLYIPPNYNTSYLTIVGQEASGDCSFQVNLPTDPPTVPHNLELPMAACGLTYFNQFEISLREHVSFGVSQDFHSLMTCSKITTVTTLTTTAEGSYGAPDTDVMFEQGVLGSMYIHARGDPSASITDSVPVGTPATLRVSLGELYKFNFDILPLICSINDVLVTSSSCSVSSSIFGEFTKHSIGEMSADFDMLRVIDPVTNVPSSSITVSCTLFVATVDSTTGISQAPVSPCITYE